MLKKLNTPIKQGMKIGKGIAAVFTLKSSKEVSTYASSGGQAAGAVALPIFVIAANYFLRKLSEQKRRLINYSFSIGVTSGSYLGALISSTMLKSLPSSFNGLIGVVSAIALTCALTLALPYVYRFVNRLRKRNQTISTTVDEDSAAFLTPEFNQRFIAGLDAGSLLGSAIGASFELMIPGAGIIGSAIAAALAAPLGGLLMGFVPQLFKAKQWQSPEQIEARFTRLKYTLSLGSSYGAAIGAVIGTFLVPGLGSLLGGLIGGGIGMLAAGVTGEIFTRNQGKHESTVLANIQMGLKIGAPVGTAVGALLGTLVFPGIGTLGGAVVGALVGSALASMVPLLRDRFFPEKNPPQPSGSVPAKDAEKTEKRFFGLNYSQLKTAISLGGAIGGLVGGVIGTVFFPGVGSVLGASVGAGIGTLLAVAAVATVQFVRGQLAQKTVNKVQNEKAVQVEESTAFLKKNLENANNQHKLVAKSELKKRDFASTATISPKGAQFEQQSEIVFENCAPQRENKRIKC